jgi:hypothetical protein
MSSFENIVISVAGKGTVGMEVEVCNRSSH